MNEQVLECTISCQCTSFGHFKYEIFFITSITIRKLNLYKLTILE